MLVLCVVLAAVATGYAAGRLAEKALSEATLVLMIKVLTEILEEEFPNPEVRKRIANTLRARAEPRLHHHLERRP